jgi:hypothetical protein
MLQVRTAVKLTFALLALWLGLVWAGLLPRPAILPPELDIEPLTFLLGTIAALLFGFWKNDAAKSEAATASHRLTEPDESLQAEIRKYLKSRYERRIRQKLAEREPVNLRKTPSFTGTSDEGAQNFITLPAEKVPSGMAELFDEARGRLLVVGAPGAGKTTLLLQLALALLERPGKDLPVLLNLATWRSEFATFDEWLRRILPLELGASKALAEKIHHNTPLILLLDGLDEVPEADRASCLRAIGEYGVEAKHRFVISSRVAEYAATQDAPVYLEVEVQPLTPQQVMDNLTAYVFLQPEAKPLLNALQTDPLLREAIANPFYLNTAQLLFAAGRKYSDFGFTATDVAGRQQELVERFVEDALGRKVKREYPKEKARKWLAGIAEAMEYASIRQFELANMQPKPKEDKLYRLILCLLTGIIPGLIWGFLIGLFGSFIQNRLLSILLSAIFGTIAGGIIGLELWLFEKMYDWFEKFESEEYKRFKKWLNYTERGDWLASGIYTTDIRIWSWKSFSRSFVISILIFSGLTPIALAIIYVQNSYMITAHEIKMYITVSFIFWVFIFVTSGELGGWYRTERFLQIVEPYQRFKLSLENFNFTLIKHFSFRLALYFQNSLPLRLVTFLNEMSLRHLLEFDGDPATGKGGGAWRWRHRIIQEHFLAGERARK